MKFIAYFNGTLEIEADSIEEAWDKYWNFYEPLKEKGLELDDIDIY